MKKDKKEKQEKVKETLTGKQKFAKIGTKVVAIIMLILIIPTLGIVWVKDSSQDPSYCAMCHDSYYEGWSGESDAEYMLVHQHEELGISCQTCHDRTLSESLGEIVNYITGNYYYPFPETQLSMDTCLACHESYDHVISLTTTQITRAERNPHAGHYGELECGECHNMHRDSVEYCASCHEPVAEGPGW